MEQFDFDKLVQEKVRSENSSHQQEIDASKPFIWAEVQRKTHGGNGIKWYHLAASIAVVILFFSFFLINIQKDHESELADLSRKINALESSYSSQINTLASRENEVRDLKTELRSLQTQLSEIETSEQEDVSPIRTVVYKTDTVYVREVEYITRTVSLPSQETEPPAAQPVLVSNTNVPVTAEIDDEIFPTTTSASKRSNTEPVKFRFGSFVAKNK